MLNIAIVLWLRIIHHDLLSLVKRRFATELRGKTIFSIREEITESLQSLMHDLQQNEGLVSRASTSYRSNESSNLRFKPNTYNRIRCLCKTGNRKEFNTPYLSHCPFLPDVDKKNTSIPKFVTSQLARVPLMQTIVTITHQTFIEWKPFHHYGKLNVKLTLDSGAESNLISLAEAKRMGVPILYTRQRAQQADGSTLLNSVGEAHFVLTKGRHTFSFNGLVVQDLSVGVLAGMPFQRANDVFTRPSRGTTHVGECCTVRKSE